MRQGKLSLRIKELNVRYDYDVTTGQLRAIQGIMIQDPLTKDWSMIEKNVHGL